MLVLSRREDDKIVFPNLGVTIEILKIAGRSVRVGVKAPSNVRVLRHELAEKLEEMVAPKEAAMSGPISSHRLRNRLNRASLGLSLLQKQLEVGLQEAADRTLENVLAEFQSLDEFLGAAPSHSEPRETRRALLVEDDANESELLAGFLRMSGYEVDTAPDGCAALDYLARNSQPDVVLLDMHMPRCDGPTTVSAIRENPEYHGLRLFAVSGREPAEVGVSVGPEGVNRWFQKPVNPQSLVTVLNQDFQLAAPA